jgi:hypothetical protein
LAQAVRDECWAEDPEKRWGFVELLKFLQNLLDDADGARSESARSLSTITTTATQDDVYSKTPLCQSVDLSYATLPSGTDLAGSADFYSKTPRSRQSSKIKEDASGSDARDPRPDSGSDESSSDASDSSDW